MPGERKAVPPAPAAGSEPVARFGYNDLLDELAGEAPPTIAADEVTATMLMERTGRARDWAASTLERKAGP
jgi:hypothetical protein